MTSIGSWWSRLGRQWRLGCIAAVLPLASAGFIHGAVASGADVVVVRTPNGGIQPQIVRDATGVMHLIYFQGDPSAGDIFYVRQAAGATAWSAPIRVNSQPGSAIATGTVRGAQLAVSRSGRVHAAWSGSDAAKPKAPGGLTPMLYSRLNDSKTAFELQRNLITWAAGINGGGSVAADAAGHVYITWHAGAADGQDAQRAVYLTRSSDGGLTFEREKRINPDDTGACACCGMRVLVNETGELYVLYRSADHNIDRAETLLVSNDGGERFRTILTHPWKSGVCPLSTAALWNGGRAVLAAWETEDEVYYSPATSDAPSAWPVAPPGRGRRKHPAVATNDKGETLLAWLEGTGWNKGGSLAWQVFDAAGRSTDRRGTSAGAPAWDLPSVTVRRDGTFLIVY